LPDLGGFGWIRYWTGGNIHEASGASRLAGGDGSEHAALRPGAGAPAQEGGPLDPVLEQVTPAQEGDNAAPAQAGSPDCNPDYTPCVPNDPVDVDCADGEGDGRSYVEGPVQVIGEDVYGLDQGGEPGVGCEGGSGGGAAPTGGAPIPVRGTARFTG
jgi:hypothetical protein